VPAAFFFLPLLEIKKQKRLKENDELGLLPQTDLKGTGPYHRLAPRMLGLPCAQQLR
jgi:hypothetical protein